MEQENKEVNLKPEIVAVPISGSEEQYYYDEHRINGTHVISQPVVHFQTIPPELVDLIVKQIENEPIIEFSNAQTGGDYDPSLDTNVRDSKVTWWYEDNWASSVISHYINIANRGNWEYELTFLNGLQITHYEADGHYTWHCDYGTSNDSRYTRKLSASLLLTDPSEYEGGELEFVDYHNNILRAPKEKGTLIIFDSRVPHRVTPVLQGKRSSIVAWMLGPKLR